MNITKIIGVVAAIAFATCWAGCGLPGTSSNSDSDRCPDGEVCGDGCMPTGADCCPNGEGYCDDGAICNEDNMCEGGGGGGGGGGDGVTTCGNCPGNLQCSQLVACLQSCTCYYTIDGSDGMSAWYLVRESYSETGTCYMCDQVGLDVNCTDAAEAAVNAAVAECF